VTYNGCDKTTTTVEAEVYLRPENTFFNRPIGPGGTIGPVFACTITSAPYWSLTGSSTKKIANGINIASGNCSGKPWWNMRRTGTYRGYRPVSREDGANFTQESAATHTANYNKEGKHQCLENYDTGTTYYPWGDPGSSYAMATANLYGMSSWDAAEGW
jgi:hypothetical protein